MASQSETNQVPVNQEQDSENLQQKVHQDTQPETENQNKTDNTENASKVQDESSALNKSGEKATKKKTKKKAKKEEEVANDVPAESKEGEVKESQPEAENTENKEEPAEKKSKKKKKTAEKIDVPTVEGEVPQQEEKVTKPKKKVTKKDNPETALVANIVAESKEVVPKEELVKEQSEAKQPTEGASKVASKVKTNETTPAKTKAKAEGVKTKEEPSNKQPEVIKTSASKPSLTKEEAKSPAKSEKPIAVAELLNKANAKASAESEKVNWKPKGDIKATPESTTKKPVNLKDQIVASPTKNESVAKNNDKRPETATPGKAKQTPQKPQKESEVVNKRPTNEVDTTTNNILEGLTPSTKEAKTPENPKSAKKVTVQETIREQRSISPRKQIKGADKQRVRSFDAGKTQKVDPNDSFETRAKVWEIRKKEKLLEEEKKSSRKEIEECTFNPAINKKSVNKNLNGDFLQRNAEWSEKVKASIEYKTSKYLEETMKSDIKKSKLQPAVGSVYGDLRTLRLHEVHRAPNSGNLRAANFELLNQDPAGVQEKLNEKLAEINDIYDNISSALKAKSARNRDDIQRATRPITMDSSRKGQPIAYPAKTLVAKVVLPASTEEVNRLDSLKSILISNKKKEQPNKSVTNNDAPSSQVYLTEAGNAQEILKKATKHLEIRNNRYVMIDNNISAIEKKDLESNDISLNLETA